MLRLGAATIQSRGKAMLDNSATVSMASQLPPMAVSVPVFPRTYSGSLSQSHRGGITDVARSPADVVGLHRRLPVAVVHSGM